MARKRRGTVAAAVITALLAPIFPLTPGSAVITVPSVAQSRCDEPAFGDPLAIDLDLPHDITVGRGVGVAVVDTGASSPGVIADRPGDRNHCLLHGTAVAGVLRTVAPAADIVSVRQSAEDNNATVADLVAAIDRARAGAADHGVRAITVSVVACEDTLELRDAVTAAVDAGLLVIAAAGNVGQCQDGQSAFPASLPGVLTVGGVDARDPASPDAGRTPAAYSVPGDWVDVYAPGGPVSGTLEVTDTAPRTLVGDPAPFTGTSFAAPAVAGTAALMWQVRPELTATEVRSLITATADRGTVPVLAPRAAVSAAMDGAAPAGMSFVRPESVEIDRVVPEPRDIRILLVLAGLVGAALVAAALVRHR